MEATATRRKRTREEILAWLDAARQRKAAFQKETNEWWQARQRSVEVRGEEGRTEYVALIVQRSNPQLEEILAVFDEEAAMFNDLKP